MISREIPAGLRGRRSRIILLFAGCVVFLCTHIPVEVCAVVDFTRLIGSNAGSMGRGGTAIAIGDDPSNMTVNPALIGETEGNALDVNLLFIFKDFDFTYTGTNDNSYTSTDKDRLLIAPGISYAHKIENSPLSWGLTMTAVDAVATDYSMQSKNFGPVNGFSEIIHFLFGPSVAYDVNQRFSVGIRLGIDYAWMDLRMPMGLAYLDIGQCDGLGLSASAGLLYKPRENLSFGLYCESPTLMNDLESKNADGFIGMATPLGEMNFSNLDVTVNDVEFPLNFGFGVAYRPSPGWRLSADLKYFDWDTRWEEMEVEFSGAGATAMDAAGIPRTLKMPVHVDDQITFGFGAEFLLSEMCALSAGYHYGDNAMTDNYLLPFIPATIEHTLTCGFSFMPTKNIKLGISYIYSIFDNPSSSAYHAYDKSLEMQLGLPPGALNSEFNNVETDWIAHNIQITISFYW
ncbi:MAG: outer membrane protein transport protein [Thermodesulfobacteriota bacterium]|nr:outer membrane protein transport protein [Thermodesulfobacteriota bacterium]